MNRSFRFEVNPLASLYSHTLRLVTHGLRLAGLDGIKERGHHRIHKLSMASCVLVIRVGYITIRPLAVALVNST